jgi:peptidoglycan hydrolase-like protein with peptidoglycan-binding domain
MNLSVCTPSLSTALIVTLALSGPASANNEFIGGVVGGIVGGIIGSQINNQNRDARPTPQRSAPQRSAPRSQSAPKPQMSALQREENRKIQTVLNAIDCNAGSPDGIFGKRTRAAIRCFQEKVEQPQTGELSTPQRAALLEIYTDAEKGVNSGGSTQAKIPDLSGRVGAGTLFAALENNTPQDDSSGSDIGAEVIPVVTQDDVIEKPVNALSVGTALDLCATQTASTGIQLPGVAPVASTNYVDGIPVTGLCEIRDSLVSYSEAKAESLGAPIDAIAEQCRVLASNLTSALATVGQETPKDTIDAAYDAVGGMATDLEAAVSSARLCTGVGYALNDSALVEASGLFGSAIGDPSLVEIVGWNLAFGIGRPKDAANAAAWLTEASFQISEIDSTLLLLNEANRSSNLREVANALAPVSGQPKTQLITLPGFD